MDYKQRVLNGLSKKFPANTFVWSNAKENKFDFCPRFALIVDGHETDILFNPEIAQDLYHGLECSRLGIEPFHPDSLMIPIVPERMEPVVNELVALYTNAVLDHLAAT